MRKSATLAIILLFSLQGISQSITFSGKVFLQGAYNTATGQMNNTLNSLGILQGKATTQPYNIPAFSYIGTEAVGAGFFAANPEIVDWILVELRESSLLSSLVSRRAAFLKTDGTIVDIDGSSSVMFSGVPAATYAVAVRHRNHMGIIADTAINFNSGSGGYDFTIAANKSLQNQKYTSSVEVGGIWAMRGGDANGNGNVKYNGPGNDQNQILNIKLGGSISNILNNVYSVEDLNMNGNIKWNGPGNDQNFLLNTTLVGSLSNLFVEQLPKVSTSSRIEGIVILPSGAPYTNDSLKINTTREVVTPANSKFSADVTYDYSTFFAVMSDSNTVLMRYNYPGQPNYNLDFQSTTLALVMNSHVAASLRASDKLKLINDLVVHPDFLDLSFELEKAIRSGANYLEDSTNTSLQQALSKIFTTISNFRTVEFNPLKIVKSGRAVSFTNYWGAAYVIGVYRGTSLIEIIRVPGVQPFATSFKEIYQGFFGEGYTSPSQKIYTLPLVDGSYTFKIRSGRPGSDNSDIWEKALMDNGDKAIKDVYDAFIPIPQECTQALRESLATLGKTYKDHLSRKYTSVSQLSEAIYDLAMTHLKVGNFLFDCGYVKDGGQVQKYLFWMKKLVKFLDVPGKVGTVGNVGFAAAGWYYANPVIDTCFTVIGNTVDPCKSLKVAFNGQYINSEINFNGNAAKAFTFLNADGSIPNGIDYNLVFITNNSNTKVSITKANTSANFSITLSINDPVTQSTTFDVLYGGKIIQTIGAVVNRGYESVVIISGNNQTAPATSTLKNPLTVEVRDINNQPKEGVKVLWKVEAGGGQVLLQETTTGSIGQSTNSWQLGASGQQFVSASVKKADGSNVVGSPLSFMASFLNGQQLDTVIIGSQVWTSKNLNVITYNNGDTIPQVKDFTQWKNLKTGAWCYYNNDSENGAKFGKLYNWYAFNDPRGLAPKGWHIPTFDDWEKLNSFVGGYSRFEAMLGGERAINDFVFLGEVGIFWSSWILEGNPMILIISNSEKVFGGYDQNDEWGGASIRFIKD